MKAAAILASVLCGLAPPAQADDATAPAQTGFWERDRLLGIVPVRLRLEDAGYKFGLQEQSEVFAVPSGGLHRDVVYDGAAQLSLTVDAGKAFGIPDGTFYLSAYQIRGRGPTPNLVGSLQAVSSLEATRSTRLYALYYEQAVLAGALSVRVGQFGADEEFLVDQYGALFISSSFGFPGLAAIDLPSGGPAYPLATPGVRIKYKPSGLFTLQGAVMNGDPAGTGIGDPQARDGSGTALRTGDGVFAIVEGVLSLNQDTSAGAAATGLAGTYKLGAFYDSQPFADQAVDSAGRSLADPRSTGIGKPRRNAWSVYGLADQVVWQGQDGRSIALFARALGGPSDRALVDVSVDGGVNVKAPIAGRPDDSAGIGAAWVHAGDGARRLDAARRLFGQPAYPIRSSETVLEATYVIQAAGWLQVQPDVQYVFSAGVPDPTRPGRRLGDAVVGALRATITF